MPRKSYYQKHKQNLMTRQREKRHEKRSCATFRAMLEGKCERDPFFMDSHAQTCDECARLYHEKKPEVYEGANLWS